MKMKIYIILFLLVALNSVYAQVGIGTTSPNGALDVLSTTDGLIIPRVALSATNVSTITTPTISELVYNTFTSAVGPNQVTSGFYYWDGSLWNKLATGNTNNDWTLSGNTGTAAATNFLGTTDNQDIVFKRFGIIAGYIGDPTYDGSFNFNNGNTAFGANSMLNPTINFGSQFGVRNTAFGVNVMPGLTTGRINVGVGEFALFSNTTGIGNTAIGSGSLYTNSTAGSNVAIGRNALTSSNSDNNTAVGFAALRQNASGTNNTALGFEALRGVLGTGNVGIGYQAGRLETGSNKLYIENSNADANSALIYGEFDNNVIRVNGTLQISNPTSAPGYALPNSRGTSGQFLQTDGAGATLWAAIPVNTVLPFATTGASTGIYTIALTQYTIRVFNGVSEVRLPTAVGNTGKIFIVIGSNGIGSKTFSTSGGTIYDDVTNANISVINPNERYTVQSDGTDWIVIGR